MSQNAHIANHVVNPDTGFLESNAYSDAFDSTRKVMFLQALRARDFDMNATCRDFGISKETIYKHKRIDPAFDRALREITQEYAECLEWVSMSNAMNPKSVIERIFQLKALRPEKYVPENKNSGTLQVTLNIDGKLLEMVKKRSEILDAEVITSTLDAEPKSLESKGD